MIVLFQFVFVCLHSTIKKEAWQVQKQVKMGTKINKKNKIQIGGHVMIPYPESEMESLKECFSNKGTYNDAFNKMNIAINTIRNIMRTGKGSKKNVEKLLTYVNAYKECVYND